jgi:hypothetical protein
MEVAIGKALGHIALMVVYKTNLALVVLKFHKHVLKYTNLLAWQVVVFGLVL